MPAELAFLQLSATWNFEGSVQIASRIFVPLRATSICLQRGGVAPPFDPPSGQLSL